MDGHNTTAAPGGSDDSDDERLCNEIEALIQKLLNHPNLSADLLFELAKDDLSSFSL